MQVDDAVRNLIAERNNLDGQIAELYAARANLDRRLKALLLEDAGLDRIAFRYGPTIVRVRPKYTLRARREQEGAVYEWLSNLADYDGENVYRRLFNLNGIRWAQLRTVVETYWRENIADPETGEILETLTGWAAFKQLYLDESEGEIEVKVIPEDKAPTFLQRLEESEAVPA